MSNVDKAIVKIKIKQLPESARDVLFSLEDIQMVFAMDIGADFGTVKEVIADMKIEAGQ